MPKARRGLREDFDRRKRRVLPWLLTAVAVAAFINGFGRVGVDLGAFSFQLSAGVPGRGLTRILLPPVGEVRATTHRAPVDIAVQLTGVDLEGLRRVVLGRGAGFSRSRKILEPGSNPPPPVPSPQAQALPPTGEEVKLPAAARQVVVQFRPTATRAVILFAIRLLLLGALAGALAFAVTGPWHLKHTFVGALFGFGLVLALTTATYVTYRTEPLATPEYKGILEAAPWMIGAASQTLTKVHELEERVALVADNLFTLFERLDNLEPLAVEGADVTVLHVSDIHNNPAAFSLITTVAKRFRADFVIDTGDLTDWGTPIEAEIVERIRRLGMTYVFVSGNHESSEILSRLNELPNVIVLDGDQTEVKGLRIVGFGDPGSHETSPGSLPLDEVPKFAASLAETVRQITPPPDVVAVHNFRIAEAIPDDLAPVVLFGHDHRLRIFRMGKTVAVDAGTTGAAGIRGLGTREGVPFSMAVLYFRRNEEGSLRLVAVDTLTVANVRGGFSLARHVF